jgi:hypothetical protein
MGLRRTLVIVNTGDRAAVEAELRAILQYPGDIGLATACKGVKSQSLVACLPLRPAQAAAFTTAMQKAKYKGVLAVAGARKQLAEAGFHVTPAPKASDTEKESGKVVDDSDNKVVGV